MASRSIQNLTKVGIYEEIMSSGYEYNPSLVIPRIDLSNIINKNKTKDMLVKDLKKYEFRFRYQIGQAEKFGSISLLANNLIHANDLFKRLYCKDMRESADPYFDVYSVTELTTLD